LEGSFELGEQIQTVLENISSTALSFYEGVFESIAQETGLNIDDISMQAVFERLLNLLRENDSQVAQAYSTSRDNRQADIAIVLEILEDIRPVYARARRQLEIPVSARSLTPVYEQRIADLRQQLEDRGYSFPDVDLSSRESVRETKTVIQRALVNLCNQYNSILINISPPVTPSSIEPPHREPQDSWFSLYADLFLHGEYFSSVPQTPDALSEWRGALFGHLTLAADITEIVRLGVFVSSGHSLGEGWTSRDRDIYTGAFVDRHFTHSRIGGYVAALFLRNIEGWLWWDEETFANVGARGAFFDELLQASLSVLFGTSSGMSLSLGFQGDVGRRDRVRLAGDFDYVFVDGGTGGDYAWHDIGLSFRVAPQISRSFRYVGAFRFVAVLWTSFGLVGDELAEWSLGLNVGLSLGDSANLYQPPVGLERF